jgi:HK97 family phage prohead protease
VSVIEAPVAVEHGSFEGYASTWSVEGAPDRQDDYVAPGAFARAVAGINGGWLTVPVTLEHAFADPRRIIGQVVEAREDHKGLWIRATLTSDDDAQAIRAKLKSGAKIGLSIGYNPVRVREVHGPHGRPARELVEVDLAHVAVVGTPANGSAFITSAKAASRYAPPDRTPDVSPVTTTPVVTQAAHIAAERERRHGSGRELQRKAEFLAASSGLPVERVAGLGADVIEGAYTSLLRDAAVRAERAKAEDPERKALERRRAQHEAYYAGLRNAMAEGADPDGCGYCRACRIGYQPCAYG